MHNINIVCRCRVVYLPARDPLTGARYRYQRKQGKYENKKQLIWISTTRFSDRKKSASRFSVARADFELSVSERRRPKHRMNLVTRMFADYLALLFFSRVK